MIGINLNVLLLTSLCFSVVIGKHNFFEEYFSKYHHHHKSSSTTPGVSSTTEISESEIVISTNPDVKNLEDDYSSKDNKKTDSVETIVENDDKKTDSVESIVENGNQYYDDNRGVFVARVAYIVASIIFVVLVFGCIVCCCPKCRGTQRTGHIIGPSVPPQPVITTPPPQPEIIQHVPPEYAPDPVQQLPPQYQQPVIPPMPYAPMHQPGYQYSPMQQPNQYSPVQQQTQYSPVHPGFQNSSTLQFYNPPEAPPPYDFTAPRQ